MFPIENLVVKIVQKNPIHALVFQYVCDMLVRYHMSILLFFTIIVLGWFGTLVMREDALPEHWVNHGPAPLLLGSNNLVDGTSIFTASPIYYWFRMD